MDRLDNKVRHLGSIRYRNHSGIILEDGRSIMDTNSGSIYESSLEWVCSIDIMEGRAPPMAEFNYNFEIPKIELKDDDDYDDRRGMTSRDEDLIFNMDDRDLEKPIEDLIKEMRENVSWMERVTLEDAKDMMGEEIETILDDMIKREDKTYRRKSKGMINLFQDDT